MTTTDTYFTIDNDYIGFIECPIKKEALKFTDYVDAVNSLHEKLADVNYNWINKEHPKSKWCIEMRNGEKRSIVYRISATKAKKLISTNKHLIGDHYDDNSEELLEEIQDITETEDGDFRCSTCDQVNSLAKNR
tara:strand:- start:460 stop:861 length:402 start_codon:yes stop_codon:yes gene_type:complete